MPPRRAHVSSVSRSRLAPRLVPSAASCFGDAARITIVGVAIGLSLTLALGKFAGALLVAVTPGDPVALGSATGVVVLVALAAAFLPAWRSSRVQPTEALRAE